MMGDRCVLTKYSADMGKTGLQQRSLIKASGELEISLVDVETITN